MARKRASSTKTDQGASPSKTAATPARSASSCPSDPVVKAKKAQVVLTHEMIAKRAYEIWERKGRPVGQDLENWQQAERELRAELGLQ